MKTITLRLLALCALAFFGAASAQQVQSKFAEANGVRIHYLEAGKGEPVLLLHGFGQTSHMWLPLIKELAKNHTVIAPDLRGYGSSAAPADGYTKAAMARDIHALMNELGYKRVALVGHDIGLMVAYAYAAQYPTEGVVVAGSGHWLMEEAPGKVIPTLVEFLNR